MSCGVALLRLTYSSLSLTAWLGKEETANLRKKSLPDQLLAQLTPQKRLPPSW